MKKQNILVTGGAGYIGSVLVPRLVKNGHNVTVLDNFWFWDDVKQYIDKLKLTGDNYTIINGDITTYLGANPLPVDNTDALVAILTEKWKSLFTQGHQSWFEYRRTGVPAVVGEDPDYVALPFPSRWRYPTYEVDNNTENANEAVARLGEDTQTAKIWIISNTTPVK